MQIDREKEHIYIKNLENLLFKVQQLEAQSTIY